MALPLTLIDAMKKNSNIVKLIIENGKIALARMLQEHLVSKGFL